MLLSAMETKKWLRNQKQLHLGVIFKWRMRDYKISKRSHKQSTWRPEAHMFRISMLLSWRMHEKGVKVSLQKQASTTSEKPLLGPLKCLDFILWAKFCSRKVTLLGNSDSSEKLKLRLETLDKWRPIKMLMQHPFVT